MAGRVGTAIAEADGAFIGTFLGVSADVFAERLNNGRSHSEEVPYTFEVHQWVKGAREAGLVDVHAPLFGASCGIGARVGEELAMAVYADGGLIRGSLCSQLDPDIVRAVMVPPITSDAPGRFLLAPGWPEDPIVVASDGSVVAVQEGGARGSRQVGCGGSVVAEERTREVALFDLSTSEDLEVLQFRRGATQLFCAGEWLLAVSERHNAASELDAVHEIFDVRTRRSVLRLTRDWAFANLDASGVLTILGAEDELGPTGWRRVDLESGETSFLTPFDADTHIDSMQVSRDGRRVAMVAEGFEDPASSHEVVVLDLNSGEAVRFAAAGAAHVQWVDDDRLFYSGHGAAPPALLRADDLAVLAEFDSDAQGRVYLLDSGALFFVDGGTLREASADGGSATVLNQLPFHPRAVVMLPVSLNVHSGVNSVPAIDYPIRSSSIEAVAASSTVVETLVDPVVALEALVQSRNQSEAVDETEAMSDDFVVGVLLTLLAGMLLAIRRRRRD